MQGYYVTIKEVSKELSAKERVMIKDTTNAMSLDEVTNDAKFVFEPDYYAILGVHNEKSEDKDYTKYVIVDKGGSKLVTGSESFFTAFKGIMDEMEGTNETFEIEAYRLPSKNYKGKEFITCSIV